MKPQKLILILFLSLFVSIFNLESFNVNAQDGFLNIGRTKIRSDEDSSRLRINRRLAREGNVQLFDFNTTNFSWSTTSGLTLNSVGDSVTSGAYIIKKDTTFGENIWTKAWRLKRSHYNESDSTVLIWHFYNTDFGGTVADWYAINTYQEDYYSTEINVLTTGWTTYYSYTPPHDGLWRVEATFEYEFAADSITVWGTSDSISVRLLQFPSTSKAYWNKKIYNPYNTRYGEAGTGYIFTETTGGLLFQAVASNTARSHVYLARIRIKSMLIQ